MLLTNTTASEYYVGHEDYFLPKNGTLTIPDQVYADNDAVAAAVNALVAGGKASASSTPTPFPRGGTTSVSVLPDTAGKVAGNVLALDGSLNPTWAATAATGYAPGGTDVALADGGTGASLVDPNADRIMFWDDSAGVMTWLQPGTGLTITGTVIDASAADGWTDSGETWTFGAADAPSYTVTIPADVTLKYAAGQRVKLTHAASVKYFIITKVSTYSGGVTTLTLYGGTDYTLAATAITAIYWSMHKAPFGFPLDPTKWSVVVTDSTGRTQSTLTQGTWYNPGSVLINVPIGVWNLSYKAELALNDDINTLWTASSTLSTGAATESDTDLTCGIGITAAPGNASQIQAFGMVGAEKVVALTAKTPYYMNMRSNSASLNTLTFLNADSLAVIRAVCAYL